MIEITYFKNFKKMSEDVILEGKLDHKVIGLIAEKCIILSYDEYLARDHDGNKIHSYI